MIYKLLNVLFLGSPWVFYKIFGQLTPTERMEYANRIFKSYVRVNIPMFGANENEFRKGFDMLWDMSACEWLDGPKDRVFDRAIKHAAHHGWVMYLNDLGLDRAERLNQTKSFDITLRQDPWGSGYVLLNIRGNYQIVSLGNCICPECGSTNVEEEAPNLWQCYTCSYEGKDFPSLDVGLTADHLKTVEKSLAKAQVKDVPEAPALRVRARY